MDLRAHVYSLFPFALFQGDSARGEIFCPPVVAIICHASAVVKMIPGNWHKLCSTGQKAQCYGLGCPKCRRGFTFTLGVKDPHGLTPAPDDMVSAVTAYQVHLPLWLHWCSPPWYTGTIDRAACCWYDARELLSHAVDLDLGRSDADSTSWVSKEEQRTMIQTHKVIIERDTLGGYVATFPGLADRQAQARSLKLLMGRIQEAMALLPEVDEPAVVPDLAGLSPDGRSD